MAGAQTMQVRVVAQDPSVRVGGRILTGLVSFPAEELEPGPTGHRVSVVDYDSSSKTLYQASRRHDWQREPSADEILGDPGFHAQNVYGLVMGTVARFEQALGRRVGWGFPAHQIKVVPHAFDVANAFYAPDSEALLFGYFSRGGRRVFTCLSHDVVVHETTHALLDGLRRRFMKPSSPDQAALHEGFADIVALLSVFAMTEVTARLVDDVGRDREHRPPGQYVPKARFRADRLRRSALFALAEEMADEVDPGLTGALRRSVSLDPDPTILEWPEFADSHRRGEVLVAAVCRAFLEVWTTRLRALTPPGSTTIDRDRAVEEGATIAGLLLTMMIRALDYTPPVHLRFGDFLSAALTADAEVRSDDSRYHLRDALRSWFGAYGIAPAAGTADGLWERTDRLLHHPGVRFSSVQSDPTEMFRLIWANRDALKLPLTAYSWVSDLWPCVRVEPEDGLTVRETVATCIQYLDLTGGELAAFGLRKPTGMADDTEVALEGGTTLVLDEYGMLKYEISNRLPSRSEPEALARAQAQIDYLYESGAFARGARFQARLANVHRLRASAVASRREETW